MKKVAIILLMFAYSLSTFGVSSKEFYCCGILKSVTVVFIDAGKDKCNKGDEKDGCCRSRYHFFKVNDKHFASGELIPTIKHYIELILVNPSYQPILFAWPTPGIINRTHAPPLHPGVPVYISNSVFRI